MPVAASDRGHDVVVVRGPAREQPLVRVPSAADEVGDHDALGRDRALREQAEGAGDLLGRAACAASLPSSTTCPVARRR